MHHAVIVKDRSAVLTAPAVVHVCGDCGTEENSRDEQLPAGWDRYEHRGRTVVRCGDCNEAIERESRGLAVAGGAGEVEDLDPLVVDPAGFANIEGRWVFNYDRCRIRHWPMPEAGGVAVQFIGGATPAQATSIDDGVLFTVTAGALDDLIEHLQAVRASIEPTRRQLAPVQ